MGRVSTASALLVVQVLLVAAHPVHLRRVDGSAPLRLLGDAGKVNATNGTGQLSESVLSAGVREAARGEHARADDALTEALNVTFNATNEPAGQELASRRGLAAAFDASKELSASLGGTAAGLAALQGELMAARRTSANLFMKVTQQERQVAREERQVNVAAARTSNLTAALQRDTKSMALAKAHTESLAGEAKSLAASLRDQTRVASKNEEQYQQEKARVAVLDNRVKELEAQLAQEGKLRAKTFEDLKRRDAQQELSSLADERRKDESEEKAALTMVAAREAAELVKARSDRAKEIADAHHIARAATEAETKRLAADRVEEEKLKVDNEHLEKMVEDLQPRLRAWPLDRQQLHAEVAAGDPPNVHAEALSPENRTERVAKLFSRDLSLLAHAPVILGHVH